MFHLAYFDLVRILLSVILNFDSLKASFLLSFFRLNYKPMMPKDGVSIITEKHYTSSNHFISSLQMIGKSK